MKSSLSALFRPAFLFTLFLTVLTTTQCAAQTQTPNYPTQDDNFRSIAAQIRNPCTSVADKASLLGVLENGNTCYEASLLADDIVFFLSQDMPSQQVVSLVSSEYEALITPYDFRLEDRPRLGASDAPVQIVVFSDFQCPFCARAAKTLHQIADARKDDVAIFFKQLPLVSIHPYAAPAAVVSTFAQSKGDFWRIHDALFDAQKNLSADLLSNLLESMGTTPQDVFDPVKGEPYARIIVEDMADAEKANVGGTPSIYVNGALIQGGANYNRLNARINAVLKAKDNGLMPTSKQESTPHHDG